MKIQRSHIVLLFGWILLALTMYILFFEGGLNLDFINSAQQNKSESTEVEHAQRTKVRSETDTPTPVLESSSHLVLNGQHFQIQMYSIGQKHVLTISGDDGPVTDPESTHRILLTSVWQQEDTVISPSDIATLEALYLQLRESREQYQGLFEVARSLEPIIEKIDELRSSRLPFDPIEIKDFIILDNNVWDVICTIPVDAADLCLLEPLARGLHEQGGEVETLLTYAAEDLNSLLVLLEKRDTDDAVDGVRLNAAAWRSYFTLLNLVIKLQEYSDNLALLQAFNADVMQAIEKEAWGDVVGKIVRMLQLIPGFDLHSITDGFLALQKDLDDKLSRAISAINDLSDSILDRVVLLEKALNATSADITRMNDLLGVLPNANQ